MSCVVVVKVIFISGKLSTISSRPGCISIYKVNMAEVMDVFIMELTTFIPCKGPSASEECM